MGLFSSTTKTSGAVDNTTTPVAPDWLQNPITDAYGRVAQIGAQDPTSFLTGPNSLQTLAGQNAAQLGGGNYFGTAAQMGELYGTGAPKTYTGAQAGAASLLGNIDAYMNPYTNDVVNSTLANYDQNANLTKQSQLLQAGQGGAGAFGGSGVQLGQALTAGQLALGRASTESGLRDQAFNTGAGLANSDADRAQQAALANQASTNAANQFNAQSGNQALDRGVTTAGLIGNLGTANGADMRANIDSQAGIGGTLRDIAQQYAASPLNLVNWQDQQYGGLPANLFVGQHQTGTSTGTSTTNNPMGAISGLLQGAGSALSGAAAAGFISDIRLKCDIERLGTRPDGLGVYLYRYLWSPLKFVGVMAQEVMGVKPEAVLVHPSGFLMVDYSKLGA